MSSSDEQKRRAALHAAAAVEDGMVLGLGTGSTVRHLLEALAQRLRDGELTRLVGVPTSAATRRLATTLGIPLSDLREHPRLDLCIDGADEVDPALNLVKGLGGALLREKIVASASDRVVILVDASKRVRRLGSRAPLPVEVDAFGLGWQEPWLRSLGCEPRLRCDADGQALVTDGGHVILDCHFDNGIEEPARVAGLLESRPGVLEHGLFMGLADEVVVAGDAGVEVLQRPPSP